MERPFIATYIEASRPMGVIYIGSTNDLYRRGREHRESSYDGFSKRHRCGKLLWYEPFEMMVSAIHRERQLKRWNRPWKMERVEPQSGLVRPLPFRVWSGLRSSDQVRG